MAIMNDKGMQSVLRPHRNLGFNAAFLVGSAATCVRRQPRLPRRRAAALLWLRICGGASLEAAPCTGPQAGSH